MSENEGLELAGPEGDTNEPRDIVFPNWVYLPCRNSIHLTKISSCDYDSRRSGGPLSCTCNKLLDESDRLVMGINMYSMCRDAIQWQAIKTKHFAKASNMERHAISRKLTRDSSPPRIPEHQTFCLLSGAEPSCVPVVCNTLARYIGPGAISFVHILWLHQVVGLYL